MQNIYKKERRILRRSFCVYMPVICGKWPKTSSNSRMRKSRLSFESKSAPQAPHAGESSMSLPRQRCEPATALSSPKEPKTGLAAFAAAALIAAARRTAVIAATGRAVTVVAAAGRAAVIAGTRRSSCCCRAAGAAADRGKISRRITRTHGKILLVLSYGRFISYAKTKGCVLFLRRCGGRCSDQLCKGAVKRVRIGKI